MGTNQDPAVNSLVNFLRDLIHEEINKHDSTEVCRIIKCNEDGTYNIVLFPDEITTLENIKSISPEAINLGDHAYIYKFNNQLNNSVIIARIGNGSKNTRFVTRNDMERALESITINGGETPIGDLPEVYRYI